MTPKHRYFIRLAIAVGTASKCRKNKVGTVIVDEHNRVVSTGYNGSPRNTRNDCEEDSGITYLSTLHSEINALMYARRDLTNCRLYCTLSPCLHCAACIIQSGITKVYYLFEYRDARGIQYLRDNGVIVKQCIYKEFKNLKPTKLI